VTFIIEIRGGGSSSGYVSAGFFGGTPFYNHSVGYRFHYFLQI
jgi:hypothetical protein